MRRNKIFMLSYIIFIFICFFARLFCDYAMWPPIVTAITVSSFLFTLADFVSVIATEYSKDFNTFTPILEEASQKCVNIEMQFVHNNAILERIKASDKQDAKWILEGPTILDATKQQLMGITRGVNTKGRISTLCHKVSIPLVMAGFLAFFCTLSFDSINGLLVPRQDYLTVFAFGALISTQYIEQNLEEERQELKDNYNNAKGLLDELESSIPRLFQIQEQEAIANAD